MHHMVFQAFGAGASVADDALGLARREVQLQPGRGVHEGNDLHGAPACRHDVLRGLPDDRGDVINIRSFMSRQVR